MTGANKASDQKAVTVIGNYVAGQHCEASSSAFFGLGNPMVNFASMRPNNRIFLVKKLHKSYLMTLFCFIFQNLVVLLQIVLISKDYF